MTRLLVGVPSRGPSPRPVRPAGRASLWTGPALSGARQHERPTGSAARSPHALRVCGEHCDGIRRGWSQDPGSSWIFGVGGCNVARRNEKTALPGGRFGCFSAPGGDWNEQPQPAISLPMTGYHLNPYHTPMLPPWCLWHVCMDWNHELLPCWRGSRAERGDSAHGPIVQRRSPAQVHTQAGMGRQARGP